MVVKTRLMSVVDTKKLLDFVTSHCFLDQRVGKPV